MEPANLLNKYQDNLPEGVNCKISYVPIEDPVMHSCGNTYERQTIQTWINGAEEKGTIPTCPMCKAHVSMADFFPNRHLKGMPEEIADKCFRPIEEQAGKIAKLREEVLEKDGKIDLLEGKNNKLEEEKIVLTVKVEVLSEEKISLINKNKELIEDIDSLEREREQLKENPTYIAAKEGLREFAKEMKKEFDEELKNQKEAVKKEIDELKEENAKDRKKWGVGGFTLGASVGASVVGAIAYLKLNK